MSICPEYHEYELTDKDCFHKENFISTIQVIESRCQREISHLVIIMNFVHHLTILRGIINIEGFVNALLCNYIPIFWVWNCFIPCYYHRELPNGPLTRYVKLRVAHAPGMPGTFPRERLQRKPLVSDPIMHHGTCVTHVPWCISGSLTSGCGENVPGIPGACTTAILLIWQEAHGTLPFQLTWERDKKTE